MMSLTQVFNQEIRSVNGGTVKDPNQLSVDPIQSNKKYHARKAKDRLRTERELLDLSSYHNLYDM